MSAFLLGVWESVEGSVDPEATGGGGLAGGGGSRCGGSTGGSKSVLPGDPPSWKREDAGGGGGGGRARGGGDGLCGGLALMRTEARAGTMSATWKTTMGGMRGT